MKTTITLLAIAALSLPAGAALAAGGGGNGGSSRRAIEGGGQSAFSQAVQPGSSAGYNGVYSGMGFENKAMSDQCGTGWIPSKLTVKNNEVMWRTGSVQPYNYELVPVPIGPNGQFSGRYGSHTLQGQIAGNRLTAYSDSGACGMQMNLTKTG